MSRSNLLVVLIAATAANCGGRGSVSPSETGESMGSSSTLVAASSSDGDEADPTAEGGTGAGAGDSSGSDTTSTTTSEGDGDQEPGVEVIELSYGGDSAQTLDLYRATPLPASPAALVVLAHGGLWQGGHKSELAPLCEGIVASSAGGIACASINYRLSFALGGVCRGVGVDTYVEQVADLASAFATLSEQAEALGLDPARIHVGGHSAGGQLAHTLNLRWSEFSSACARFGGCTPPAGAIGFEGVYDIAAWHAYDAAFWSGQWACATRRAFGGPPGSPEVCVDDNLQVPCWDAGSPTYLAAHAGGLGLAPVGAALIVHSPADDWVDVAEATSFAAALSSAFADLDVIVATDGTCGAGSHGGVLLDPALASCIVNFVSSGGKTI